MNIIFKTIRFKNFLSYGNAMTEVQLNKVQLTSIEGQNGSGKTSILNALIYGLYGKLTSKIQLGKLVNTINKKNLLVEVEYDRGGHSYLIRRGKSPSVFEIYQDNILVPQESSVVEYQNKLETDFLGINIENFTQLVVVGGSGFQPFMTLSAKDKRAIIEEILGVSVLTSMNSVLKTRVAENRQKMTELEARIYEVKTKARSEKNIIDSLKQIHAKNIENLKSEITKRSDALEKKNEVLTAKKGHLEKLNAYLNKENEFLKEGQKITQERNDAMAFIRNLNRSSKAILENNTCPTCQQEISEEHKAHVKEKVSSLIEEKNEKLKDINSSLEKFEEQRGKFNLVHEKINEVERLISSISSEVKYIASDIERLTTELNTPEVIVDIKPHEDAIKQLGERFVELSKHKATLDAEFTIMSMAERMLKDNGIKTSVVNQYLTTINRMINHYLNEMDFFISFSMDNEFNETIKARERDELNYFNLSQGERKRLDLAILFTWRYIASVRNSCVTNTLFLDEVDDGLDAVGSAMIIKLFRSFVGSNIFVISHKDTVQDSEFDRVLYIKKENQFSKINEY